MVSSVSENDVVLCTVKRIEKTTVFLVIEGDGEGTMIFSEVSPGRIRNIRDFISINKRIVCKVLRVRGDHVELSLRRVSAKDRDEVLDRYKKERTLKSILKPVLKDKTVSVLDKIRSEFDLADFLDEVRESPKLICKFVPADCSKSLMAIFAERREKDKVVVRTVRLKSSSSSGLSDIKKILSSEVAEVHYLGSSKFSVSVTAKDFKSANNILDEVVELFKNRAKELGVSFEAWEK